MISRPSPDNEPPIENQQHQPSLPSLELEDFRLSPVVERKLTKSPVPEVTVNKGPVKPSDPIRFERFHQHLLLRGDPNKPALIFVGGLAHTRFPVTSLGLLTHKHTGCTTLIQSLPTHTDLAKAKRPLSKDGINQALTKKISELADSHPGVGYIGYSTAGLAVLDLANSGKYPPVGVACIGAPVHLKDQAQQQQLDLLFNKHRATTHSMARIILGTLFRHYTTTHWIPVPEGNSEEPHERKNAHLTGIHLESLLALRTYQEQIRKGLPNVTCPSFFAVGLLDQFATVECANFLAQAIPTGAPTRVHVYHNSPHCVQLGPEKRKFFRDFFHFLEADLNLIPSSYGASIKIKPHSAA